jgi:orotate phosphoribosyltransferase
MIENHPQATLEEKKQQLLNLLKEKSFQYRPDPPFKLASGRESPYYLDCRPTTHNAQGLALIGEIFFDLIRDLKVKAIGGLTMGADPIAHAVALTSYLQGRPINSFSVRKEPKEHGIGKRVEGDARPGDRVVIVEDVITTGGSTLQAITAAREYGLEVVQVIVLVDREEGGREAVEKLVSEFEAVFTLSQFT